MSETYCGKSCNNCAYKERLGCSGCRECMGKPETGKCELAKCCRNKGHQTCETCDSKTSCVTRWRRQSIPQYMIEQQNAELVEKAKSEQIKAQIAQSAPFLGKWLSILFWVTIISILAGILRYKKIAELVPALYSLGWIISVLCMIARGLVLLMMCSESFRYFKSGICSLVAAIFNALPAIIISGAIDDLILYFFLLVVELILFVTLFVGEYYEYTGHAEVLQHVDIVQSEKWRKLWKWYIGIPIVLIGCLILAYLLPDSQYWRTSNILVLNVLLIVLRVASIGVFIVAILKYVYLYRTAKIFKWYS